MPLRGNFGLLGTFQEAHDEEDDSDSVSSYHSTSENQKAVASKKRDNDPPTSPFSLMNYNPDPNAKTKTVRFMTDEVESKDEDGDDNEDDSLCRITVTKNGKCEKTKLNCPKQDSSKNKNSDKPKLSVNVSNDDGDDDDDDMPPPLVPIDEAPLRPSFALGDGFAEPVSKFALHSFSCEKSVEAPESKNFSPRSPVSKESVVTKPVEAKKKAPIKKKKDAEPLGAVFRCSAQIILGKGIESKDCLVQIHPEAKTLSVAVMNRGSAGEEGSSTRKTYTLRPGCFTMDSVPGSPHGFALHLFATPDSEDAYASIRLSVTEEYCLARTLYCVAHMQGGKSWRAFLYYLNVCLNGRKTGASATIPKKCAEFFSTHRRELEMVFPLANLFISAVEA